MRQHKAHLQRKFSLVFSCSALLTILLFSCNIFGAYDNPKDPKNNGGVYHYYSVVYNRNGATSGTVPVDSTTYAPGTSVTIIGNTGNLAKQGYTFAGWNTMADGTGTSYAAGSTFVMGSASVTLYARWSLITYTVTYNANGATSGAVPVDSNSYAPGSTVTVLGNIGNLSKPGYTFTGWNTKADGTGTSYAPGSTFTMGSANVTLYAKWSLVKTYTVTYHANGATSGTIPIDNNNYEEGMSVTVLGNTGNLAKPGYTFAGWNTKADGTGTSYAAGSTFTMGSADMTLYARWSLITYTVTYNANGATSGTAPVDNASYTPGATVTVMGNTGNLAKPGYTFAGWNTKADGTGTSYTAGSAFAMGSANVTLYARWSLITYNVTYNANGATSGIVPVDSTSYAPGESVTVLGNSGNLVKPGYVFAGWNTKADGTGISYAAGSTFTIGVASLVLYACWNVAYSVTYQANGATSGTVPIDTNGYAQGATVTVLGNTGNLSKPGYSFEGWNTKSDGSGTSYTAGSTFTMGTVNVILYARWKLIKYSITYDANGATSGTVPVDSNTYAPGATATILGNTGNLFKIGYTFVNWNTKADGTGTSYSAGSNLMMGSANVTLYAQWNALFKAVSAGYHHSMIIKNDGTLWAVGENTNGQLGDGTATDRQSPVQVMRDVLSVASGFYHTMILKTDGTLWAAGSNGYGQLGNGIINDRRYMPMQVMNDVQAIFAKENRTMIIKTDGTLWATGTNGSGQLGDGDNYNYTIQFKQIMNDVKSVATGGSHTMILKTDGTLWATGANGAGQLGDGTNIERHSPVKIMSDVKSVAAGGSHTMILKTDGTLWATGDNFYGQLGDGTKTYRNTPVMIMCDVQAIDAGCYHTLLIKTDGTLWAAGFNQFGQLGDNTITDRSTPVMVMSDVQAVSAGWHYTMIIKNDGTLWANGLNNACQLGTTFAGGSTPVQISF